MREPSVCSVLPCLGETSTDPVVDFGNALIAIAWEGGRKLLLRSRGTQNQSKRCCWMAKAGWQKSLTTQSKEQRKPIKSNRSVKEVTAAIVTFLYILLFVILALISPIPVSIGKVKILFSKVRWNWEHIYKVQLWLSNLIFCGDCRTGEEGGVLQMLIILIIGEFVTSKNFREFWYCSKLHMGLV